MSYQATKTYHPEYKTIDLDSGYLTTGTSNGAIVSINCVSNPASFEACSKLINGAAQGTGYNEHVGDRAKPIKLSIRGQISPGNDPTSYEVVRIMVIHDRHSNGTTVGALSNVLQFSNSNPFVFNNLKNRHRFTVLKDKFIPCGRYDAAGDDGSTPLRLIRWNINLRKLPATQYVQDTTNYDYQSVQEGAIYIVAIGNTETASAEYHRFDFIARYRFQDM